MHIVEVTFDGARDPVRCRCKDAVLRTYKQMIKDQPKYIALDAARRVYSHHNPNDKFCDAVLTVELWISHEFGTMQ